MTKILEIKNLNKTFKKASESTKAVSNFSCQMNEGECIGIVGESGSGKSTIAVIIAGFVKADSGSIFFDGNELVFKGKAARLQRKSMQMIFQNPTSALNPHMTILDNLKEAVVYYEKIDKDAFYAKAAEELKKMGLTPEYLHRYPKELSGGECQRATIARSLIGRPKLLICDEITSALDVCVQAEIIRYLLELKKSGISILFITHDITLTSQLCDRIIVMKQGKIVESGNTKDILENPVSDYTRMLVGAAY
ncbi:ABC transporter ATP-binding protein [Butyrivibrio sp. AE3006]|uniref:ABC transporter ATP-binding protein n=1 Tax=Butyrivibrio sp. AE3006 TaxID=1280673 RepID=UPI000406CFAE|nr:dipeptide/oligopeptide/nickel ABC transporter ATP-binding protein [Butyrivibrio sp. AE3006]